MKPNWSGAQKATAFIVKKVGDVEQQLKDLNETQKGAWATIIALATKAAEAGRELDRLAKQANDAQAADAGKQLTDMVQAVDDALALITPARQGASADDDKELEVLGSALGGMRGKRKAVSDALELAAAPNAPAASSTPAAPGTPAVSSTPAAPGTPAVSSTPAAPGTPAVSSTPAAPSAPAASSTPAAPGAPAGSPSTSATAVAQTPAAKACEAAEAASKHATTAESQAALIAGGDTLEKMKAAASKVAEAAALVLERASEAKAQAGEAAGKAKDADKPAWQAAERMAGTAYQDALDLKKAAASIAEKTAVAEAKAAAASVVTAAQKAKGSAADAKQALAAASAAGSVTAPAPKAPAAPASDNKDEKKDEAKQVPNSFGVSITAAYSRKFSLDTTVHSKIEVTMVPYPPPQQFLDWVRAQYERQQPPRPPGKAA